MSSNLSRSHRCRHFICVPASYTFVTEADIAGEAREPVVTSVVDGVTLVAPSTVALELIQKMYTRLRPLTKLLMTKWTLLVRMTRHFVQLRVCTGALSSMFSGAPFICRDSLQAKVALSGSSKSSSSKLLIEPVEDGQDNKDANSHQYKGEDRAKLAVEIAADFFSFTDFFGARRCNSNQD